MKHIAILFIGILFLVIGFASAQQGTGMDVEVEIVPIDPITSHLVYTVQGQGQWCLVVLGNRIDGAVSIECFLSQLNGIEAQAGAGLGEYHQVLFLSLNLGLRPDVGCFVVVSNPQVPATIECSEAFLLG